MAGPSTTWRIFADTGGTFTDCLGIAPDGSARRAKVLSSGSLRGRVAGRPGDGRLRLELPFALPDGFLVGARLGPLPGDDRPLYRVVGHDGAAEVVELGQGKDVEPLGAERTDRAEPRSVARGLSGAVALETGLEAPVLGAHILTGTPLAATLPPVRMRLGTTRGTNALLERAGSPPALFITAGFADLLRIGTQQRPDLFALDVRKEEPLHGPVVEVRERLAADGSVLVGLDLEAAGREARRVLESGVRTAACVLMHSWVNPGHERRLAELLRSLGFEHVSVSSTLAPVISFLTRAQTCVVNAYLAPVIEGYLGRVAEHVGGNPSGTGSLHVMTSAGGLVRAEEFAPKDSLLSGPAGGVVGAAAAGRAAGFERLIAFDMGGTSTDAARYDGDFDYTFEHGVGGAGFPIAAPALNIRSVAAGGGSVCWLDRGQVRVGPRSAGADPGPACYGAGGPLTITDVNLLLGRIDPGRFGIPIDAASARRRAEELHGEFVRRAGERVGLEPFLEGLLRIADERMADAIAAVSAREGYDPGEYALVAFGGAGPQHACAVASRLGVRAVVVPPDASLLSARGLGEAVIERFAQRQVLRLLGDVGADLEGLIGELESEARGLLLKEGVEAGRVVVRRRIAALRLAGQESTLGVEYESAGGLGGAFARRYEQVYGHAPPERAVEVESVRVVVSADAGERFPAADGDGGGASERGEAEAFFDGRWCRALRLERAALEQGQAVRGPALVVEVHTVTAVAPGWECAGDGSGALVLKAVAGGWEGGEKDDARGVRAGGGSTGRAEPSVAGGSVARDGGRTTRRVGTRRVVAPEDGPLRLELIINRLGSIATQMGQMLQRTALSTNVKERLDFSCAVLDGRGRLVVNAPHVPVHLGSLGLCVRAVRERLEMGEGDVLITNHPGFGGSHLPDITVISPVHHGGRLIAYVASRAHHAEIGGIRPGSMPPDARSLAEEGVVIEPGYLVRGPGGTTRRVDTRRVVAPGGGDARTTGRDTDRAEPRSVERGFGELRALLCSGPYPSRAVEENIADIAAAVAANHRGAGSVAELAGQVGVEAVSDAMDALRGRAASRLGEALEALGDGVYEAEELLDDGSPIRVRITVAGGKAEFDFTGSAPMHAGNLNATPAIVSSAVVYVLRLLVREAMPLNEGLLEPVRIVLPGGMLSPPFPADPAACPAVAGGNVETSQRLVDTLLKALGLAACSQGTMNNVLFGADAVVRASGVQGAGTESPPAFGYYETVCGGAGAGPGFGGADAVHTHMTNTRITDAEVLEKRYPVRVERFGIRRRSGGAGRWRGGDGVVRELTFLSPVRLSVVTQHRSDGPYGLEGGSPGAAGRQRVVRADGSGVVLGSIDGCDVGAGDRLVLETPGGGGYGRADSGGV